jgi:uncharacterized membrane protein
MTTMVWTHLTYLGISTAITVWVGRTLRKHGSIFAADGDESRSDLLDSFAHLLEVGFYLLNFGVISMALKAGERAEDMQTAIELLSTKFGAILFVLGFIHLLMIAVFSGARKRKQHEKWVSETGVDRSSTVRRPASV